MTKTLTRFLAFVGALSFVLNCMPAQADSEASCETTGVARFRQRAYQQMQEEARRDGVAKQKEQKSFEDDHQRRFKKK